MKRVVGVDDGRAVWRLILRLTAAGARSIRLTVDAGTVHADFGGEEVLVVGGDRRLHEDGTVTVGGDETTPEALPPRGSCRVPAGGVSPAKGSEDALTRTDRVALTEPADKPERA